MFTFHFSLLTFHFSPSHAFPLEDGDFGDGSESVEGAGAIAVLDGGDGLLCLLVDDVFGDKVGGDDDEFSASLGDVAEFCEGCASGSVVVDFGCLCAEVVDDHAGFLQHLVDVAVHFGGCVAADDFPCILVYEYGEDVLADECLAQSAGADAEQSPTLIVGEPVHDVVVAWEPLSVIAEVVAQPCHEPFTGIGQLYVQSWWVGVEAYVSQVIDVTAKVFFVDAVHIIYLFLSPVLHIV